MVSPIVRLVDIRKQVVYAVFLTARSAGRFSFHTLRLFLALGLALLDIYTRKYYLLNVVVFFDTFRVLPGPFPSVWEDGLRVSDIITSFALCQIIAKRFK